MARALDTAEGVRGTGGANYYRSFAELSDRAGPLPADPLLGVRCEVGDALDPTTWPPEAARLRKVTVGFALDVIPPAWREALPEGAVIVAPLRDEAGVLRLCRAVLRAGELEQTWGHEVSYVPARTAPPCASEPRAVAATEPARREPIHLPVLD